MDVKSIVIESIKETIPITVPEIHEGMGFIEDLAYTSISMVKLMVSLENKFNLQLDSEEDLERIESVGDLIDLISSIVAR